MLSEREKEVVQLAADGLSSKEIGQRLSISVRTVETHLKSARDKLGAKNTCHLVSIAHRYGLITALFLTCSLGAVFYADDAMRPSRVRGGIARLTRQSRGKREWEILG